MYLAVFAPLGLVIGSFLNVVAYRLPRGESLMWPGSHCTTCGTDVKAYDNVPVVSWLVLRGRCRSCGDRISARYPLVELVTGVAFIAIALANGFDEKLLLELPFAAALIAVAGIDLEHRIVPNKIVLPLAVYGVAMSAVLRTGELPELLIAGGAAFAFMLICALAYPGGMGMGDVKLAGAMGLYLGLSVVPALLLAFFAGSVVGIAIMVRQGAEARKKGVPFAPFLALGGLVGVIAGPELIDLYTRTFL
jgi:leader peptidase (prepilin peptidase)/N-methyltransferase